MGPFGSLAVLLLMGVPVALSIGVSSMLCPADQGSRHLPSYQRMVMGIDVSLLALPLFMLAGT